MLAETGSPRAAPGGRANRRRCSGIRTLPRSARADQPVFARRSRAAAVHVRERRRQDDSPELWWRLRRFFRGATGEIGELGPKATLMAQPWPLSQSKWAQRARRAAGRPGPSPSPGGRRAGSRFEDPRSAPRSRLPSSSSNARPHGRSPRRISFTPCPVRISTPARHRFLAHRLGDRAHATDRVAPTCPSCRLPLDRRRGAAARTRFRANTGSRSCRPRLSKPKQACSASDSKKRSSQSPADHREEVEPQFALGLPIGSALSLRDTFHPLEQLAHARRPRSAGIPAGGRAGRRPRRSRRS